jgi:hypothetical protein
MNWNYEKLGRRCSSSILNSVQEWANCCAISLSVTAYWFMNIGIIINTHLFFNYYCCLTKGATRKNILFRLNIDVVLNVATNKSSSLLVVWLYLFILGKTPRIWTESFLKVHWLNYTTCYRNTTNIATSATNISIMFDISKWRSFPFIVWKWQFDWWKSLILFMSVFSFRSAAFRYLPSIESNIGVWTFNFVSTVEIRSSLVEFIATDWHTSGGACRRYETLFGDLIR